MQDVRGALSKMAATHATRTLQKAHNCLTRVIRHAEGQDLVRRNVSALVDTPQGQAGRPSQSLTLEQAAALLEAAEKSRLHAFIALCLLTGVRSEEARALTWDHVDLDAGTIMVWRSVRAHGDTKTTRSRRTLKLPEIAVEALRAQKRRQAEERGRAGEQWQEHGLVLTTSVGTPFESHNLRREFRKVTAAAGLGTRWVPKELRTSFVSMMSYHGVPVEEIARLAGHASSRTTEVIYRRELRPVITTGAEVMDQIFGELQHRLTKRRQRVRRPGSPRLDGHLHTNCAAHLKGRHWASSIAGITLSGGEGPGITRTVPPLSEVRIWVSSL